MKEVPVLAAHWGKFYGAYFPVDTQMYEKRKRCEKIRYHPLNCYRGALYGEIPGKAKL